MRFKNSESEYVRHASEIRGYPNFSNGTHFYSSKITGIKWIAILFSFSLMVFPPVIENSHIFKDLRKSYP